MIFNEKYNNEIKQFVTSHRLYSAIRIALGILIPSLILGYFGLFNEYYLFPIGTCFTALVDQPGPLVRRRNTLIGAILSFLIVATIASLLQDYTTLIFIEIIIFGVFYSMLGVYGPRLGGLGSISLIIFAIFFDGHLVGENITNGITVFILGCIWYLGLLLVLAKIQPYQLAKQMIGENYIALAKFLEIKASFYDKDSDYNNLISELLTQQVAIKNAQETTKELIFQTRKLVKESTTTSRILTFQFSSSIDVFDKIITSENDYHLIHEKFGNEIILKQIKEFLLLISNELLNIGIETQSGITTNKKNNLNYELEKCFNTYFYLREQKMTSDNLDDFMILKQIIIRLKEIKEDIVRISNIRNQNIKLAKSLSSGLDSKNLKQKEDTFNLKVLFKNISLKSIQFRHALRVTIAMLIGYFISLLNIHDFGHSYWVIATIVAIMRPAYGLSKSRNLLRFFGTMIGALIGYSILWLSPATSVQLIIICITMVLCFTMLKKNYFWAIMFMTVYILMTFNFINPDGFISTVKDRLFDTTLACVIALIVTYFIFPVWEKRKTKPMLLKIVIKNKKYLQEILNILKDKSIDFETYQLLKKSSIISLANLSEHFQKLLSEPKNQQENLEHLHQFVNTSHLKTAYISSLSQYVKSEHDFSEIDFEKWEEKITNEFQQTEYILQENPKYIIKDKITPNDEVDKLLDDRKKQLNEDSNKKGLTELTEISKLTELKNIQESLQLIYEISKQQRKIAEKWIFENHVN